jgi:DNA-binding transcriptional regulator GbsR (MarR family)
MAQSAWSELPPATRRIIDFLGDLGSRWGLPAQACRIHGYLYLAAKPLTDAELRAALAVDAAALAEAVAWLADYRLIERVRHDAWRTESDPWELVMRALDQRRRREITPALALLRESHAAAIADGGRNRTVAEQIGKLLALAEDVAAIDTQARRFSSRTLRRMVGLGGFAARMMDRTFGRGGER